MPATSPAHDGSDVAGGRHVQLGSHRELAVLGPGPGGDPPCHVDDLRRSGPFMAVRDRPGSVKRQPRPAGQHHRVGFEAGALYHRQRRQPPGVGVLGLQSPEQPARFLDGVPVPPLGGAVETGPAVLLLRGQIHPPPLGARGGLGVGGFDLLSVASAHTGLLGCGLGPVHDAAPVAGVGCETPAGGVLSELRLPVHGQPETCSDLWKRPTATWPQQSIPRVNRAQAPG